MRPSAGLLLLGLSLGALAPALAQESPTLRRAVQAYDELAYGQAIALARRASRERLEAKDQRQMYEILGFAYASLDSARQATEAFKQVLLLNADRELDPLRVSPKITSVFALALGQVLVIRHLRSDTTELVAGQGTLPIHFTVTRTARITTRIVGPGGQITVDSSLNEGAVRLDWDGLFADRRPPAGGDYRVVVEVKAGRDSYAASLPIRIEARAVDTVAHLTSLPGYEMLSETVVPPRSWKPVGLALLATSVAIGGSLALENSKLGGGGRREILTIGAGDGAGGAPRLGQKAGAGAVAGEHPVQPTFARATLPPKRRDRRGQRGTPASGETGRGAAASRGEPVRSPLAVVLLMGLASPAVAQRIGLEAGYALASYREQADFLRFNGDGPAAGISVARGRFALRVNAVRLDLRPVEDGAGLEGFTLDQVDARLAVLVRGPVALEVGYLHRGIEPSRAAQSFNAARFGVRAAYPLAPGASVGLRTAYLAGGDFTGGGRAPFAIEIGLGAAYGPGGGRVQLRGDYEFQRIDRRTRSGGQELRVPIESSIARVGVGVSFDATRLGPGPRGRSRRAARQPLRQGTRAVRAGVEKGNAGMRVGRGDQHESSRP